ncbi:MAG: ribonucleoside-diphosphate reductase subunit alpha [Bdellovibrionales bacterium]
MNVDIEKITTNEVYTDSTNTQTTKPSDTTGAPKVMHVKKRNGDLVPVDVNKIVNVVIACSNGLPEVDPMRIATKAISGLYDGATTKELDELCMQTASMLISEDPAYSKLAQRLLNRYIQEEVSTQNISNFFDSVRRGCELGLISEEKAEFVFENKEALNLIIDRTRNDKFEYFGLKTVYDRYLLKHPETRQVVETPQYFFLRVACGLGTSFPEAKEFYDLISQMDYMPSSPTLFNSATLRPQLSSCYLLDSPADGLADIYDKYKDIALLSKFAGGIGVAFSRVRSRGSLIKGTNGKSNGLIPWLKTLDSSVAAVNQGGRRKGAACIYLETWHADIEEFLELRDNTGDEAARAHNINLANWVPDLFMERVKEDGLWSLFDPKKLPRLVDTFGDEFKTLYTQAEKDGVFERQVKARDLYSRMMKTLAQTGNGWMTFKDASNKKSNQTGEPQNVIHLSNLCTEILEVTSKDETAVCNLGSVNLSNHVVDGKFDFTKLAQTVQVAVKYLDKVIDINFYPIPTAKDSNNRWRPVGLGVMGLQDAFFKLGYKYDSPEALELSTRIQEEVYYWSLRTSTSIAKQVGPHKAFKETRAAKGDFQFDLWGVKPTNRERWEDLRKDMVTDGLRNSLMIAIAPTATIATITGVFEAIEPQVSNYFKRETLSGEFIQTNKYLAQTLKERGLWNDDIRAQIKDAEGSIGGITDIPQDIRDLYRTAWELPQKALIDLAAARGPYIDQSQSLNLFIESPSIGKLSSMYMYAWEKGVKTTYYLRSRPATKIAKTVGSNSTAPAKKTFTKEEALACSLENPEVCEACQ